MPFGRPFWMSEEEYREAIQKQGIHSLVLVLSTEGMKEAVARDADYVDFVGRVEATEEKQLEPGGQETAWLTTLLRGEVLLPEGAQVLPLAAEAQPALALEEDDEQQAVE